jgi:hypothetical protein
MKKFIKIKYVCFILAISILACSTVFADNIDLVKSIGSIGSDLTDFDLWLISGIHVICDEEENKPWTPSSYIKDTIPLFDLDNNVIAYYLNIYPSGYMIINNNLNNPVILEFGYNGEYFSDNQIKISDSSRYDEKNIYLGNGCLFNVERDYNNRGVYDDINIAARSDDNLTVQRSVLDDEMAKFKLLLNTYNADKVDELNAYKNELNNIYNSDAVAGSNTTRGLNGYEILTTPHTSLISNHGSHWSTLKQNIDSNNMLFFIIQQSSGWEMHYVNVVGYREYSGGEKYARIIDNWTNTVDRWYLFSAYIVYMGTSYVTY